MTRVFYIIEHPTRGTFREMDASKPRFSTSGMRSDTEKARRFHTVDSAQDTIYRIMKFDTRLGLQCRIRRSPDYQALCPECYNWCDHWHDHKKTCSVYDAEVQRHLYG